MANGLYILETKGPEYRLAYSEEIDKIYSDYNDINLSFDPNPENIKNIFGLSKVYTSQKEVLQAAYDMLPELGFLSDGICVIPEFQHRSYSRLDLAL